MSEDPIAEIETDENFWGKLKRWRAGLRPTKIIVELTAGAVCVLIVGIVATLVFDQVAHWSSESYRSTQAERRDFFCARHFDPETKLASNATNVKNAEFHLQQLLETARLRASPTDSVGKFRNFFLCSTVSSVSLKSVEIVPVIGTGNVVSSVTTDNVSEMLGRLKTIKAAVKRYPDTIYDQQSALLTGLIVKVEEEVRPTEIDLADGVDPTWLLVVGADQTDEAALDEVARTQALIDGLDAKLKVGVEQAQIYRIRSWRRTVVPFASKESAIAAFAVLEPNLKYGGYLRAEAKWCSELVAMKAVKSIPVTRCGP